MADSKTLKPEWVFKKTYGSTAVETSEAANASQGDEFLNTDTGEKKVWTGLSWSTTFTYKSNYIGVGGVPTNKMHVFSPNYAPLVGERTTSYTSSVWSGVAACHKTSGTMVDGFGTDISFQIQQGTGSVKELGSVGAVKKGLNGELVFIVNGITFSEKARITEYGSFLIGKTIGDGTSLLEVAGDSVLNGKVVLKGDPKTPLEAATKQYVDNATPNNVQTFISTTYTAKAGDLLVTDTRTAPFTVTLPSVAADGQYVTFSDGYGTWFTNNLTVVAPAGVTVVGVATGFIGDVNGASFTLVKRGTNWVLI